MNKEYDKKIVLTKAKEDAMQDAQSRAVGKCVGLMSKDNADLCSGSLDVLIVNVVLEYNTTLNRIQNNFDNAVTLLKAGYIK